MNEATEPVEEHSESRIPATMAAKLNRAAEELKATLSIDEGSFRILAPQAHSCSCDYFVFEALDELQKAMVGVIQALELLSGEKPDPEEAFTRIAAESTGDGLALWQRKLIEMLANLIGFSATPEDAYFRDCLLHAQLDQQLSGQRDLVRFYGAESCNLAHQIAEVAAEVEALEAAGLNPGKAWYRRHQAPFELKKVRPGIVLASFARRFDHALSIATDAERAGLGFSYASGFGQASASVHARPGGLELVVDLSSVMSDVKGLIAIGLSVLIRCQVIIGKVPGGENEWFRDLSANIDGPTFFLQNELRGNAAVGDIVMAHDVLAQVLEIAEGSTGYRSYRVRYLSQSLLPEIPEDWHVAQHVKVVLNPRLTRQMVEEQAANRQDRGFERLLLLSDEKLMAAIGESIAKSEQAGIGIREAILAAAVKKKAEKQET